MEYCVNGVFGSVCDVGFDKKAALVVCKQLGYGIGGKTGIYYISFTQFLHSILLFVLSLNYVLLCCNKFCIFLFLHAEPYVYYGSMFGDGNGPIVYSDVMCGGWEASIGGCMTNQYPASSCSRKNVVGIACRDGKIFFNLNILYS